MMSLVADGRAGGDRGGLALADERQSLDWATLEAILNRATNRLISLRLPAHRRGAVFAGNSVEVVIAHQAMLGAAVSSVPVNFHLTAEECAYILKDAGASLLFVGPETRDAGIAAARLANVDTVIGWRCEPREGLIAWNDWIAQGAATAPPRDRTPAPHLHYTSGTTGRPKGTLTPPTMFPALATTAEFSDHLRTVFADNGRLSPALVVSPIYHTGPMGAIRLLGGGQAIVVMSHFDAETVLAKIERYRVQVTLMVPTHFQRLLALPEDVRRRYDISSMRLIQHTGAACPPVVKRRMIEWFGPILREAYGATEAGSTNAIDSREWLERPGSVGRTLPPFEVHILSDDGARLAANEVGTIYFRDTTGRGIVFHNDPARTADAHREPGVFTLGDMGYVDDAGYLFITDRVSDMIVSGGVNIYPAEIEAVLTAHPDVADVAVIGVPNPDFGEEVKALIIPRDPREPPTANAMRSFVAGRLAGYKKPRSYEFVATLGRNAMGKINKRELRRPYWPSDRTIGG